MTGPESTPEQLDWAEGQPSAPEPVQPDESGWDQSGF
jgi:hypothetical protein